MAAPVQLRSVKPPWVHLVVLDPGKNPESALAVPSEFAVRTIDGRRGATKRGLLGEFARALGFPKAAAEGCLLSLGSGVGAANGSPVPMGGHTMLEPSSEQSP